MTVRTPVEYLLQDGVTTYTPSVGQRIIDEWIGRLQEMDLTNSTVFWTHVERGSPEHLSRIQDNVIGFYEMHNKYSYGPGWCMCIMKCGVEFWYKRVLGMDIMTNMKRLETDLRKLFMGDQQSTELATGDKLSLYVHTVASQLSSDSPKADFATGYMEVDIQYRTAYADPTIVR